MVTIRIPEQPIIVPLVPQSADERHHTSQHAPIHLESHGYIIRSVTGEDVDEKWLDLINRPQILRGLNLTALNFSLSQLRQFVSGFDNHNNYFLGIFDQSDGSFVGFYTIDINHTHKVASFTTGIDTRLERGKRTLWATNDVVLEYFYEHRGIEKFTARVLARNYAMIFNFKGSPTFTFEACLRNECQTPDGERVDILVFSAFKTMPEQYKQNSNGLIA